MNKYFSAGKMVFGLLITAFLCIQLCSFPMILALSQSISCVFCQSAISAVPLLSKNGIFLPLSLFFWPDYFWWVLGVIFLFAGSYCIWPPANLRIFYRFSKYAIFGTNWRRIWRKVIPKKKNTIFHFLTLFRAGFFVPQKLSFSCINW